MPKPLRCQAGVEGRALFVQCEHISSGELAQAHELTIQSLGGHIDGRPFVSSGPVLVLGGGDSLLLPLDAVRRWYQDFHLVPNALLSERPPSNEESIRGAKAVILVSRVDEVDPLLIPPDIEGLVRAVRRARRPF